MTTINNKMMIDGGDYNQETRLDILEECSFFPDRVVSSTLESKVNLQAYPGFSICQSYDIPPKIAAAGINLNDDLFLDYESCLGIYNAKKKKIIIYTNGIKIVAEALGLKAECLRKVVLLHECAHAIHHLGSFNNQYTVGDENREPGSQKSIDDKYLAIPSHVHEQIAQLTTLLAIRNLVQNAKFLKSKLFFEKLFLIFSNLARRQSEFYQVPQVALRMDPERLRKKVRLLINLADSRAYPRLVDIEQIMI